MSRHAWVEQVMGRPVSVHVRGADPSAEAAVQRLFDDLRGADRVFSTYRDDSDLARWESGALALTDADPTLAEVLALGEEARVRTEGWFDPRHLPDPRDGHLRYDPSGLVKGWAVERATARLGGYDWCVNAGGDVVVHGAGAPWRVGIEDPADPSRLARVVSLTEGAIATSGAAHRGAHIVDPVRGRPVTDGLAATVMGPSLLWADVYATAAVARGLDALRWLDARPGYEALLIASDGRHWATTGWPLERGEFEGASSRSAG